MMKKIRYALYHVTVIMAFMYIVFYFIDRVNSAMAFINNDITKALLLVMCILTIFNTLQFIMAERERLRRKLEARRRKQAAQQNRSGN